MLFPATFAAGDGFPGGYNIDGDPNGTNICLIDSVGSQANRIEPLFAEEKYKALVPQVVVKAGEKEVNLARSGPSGGRCHRSLLGVAADVARRLQVRAERRRRTAGQDRPDLAGLRSVGLARHPGEAASAGRIHDSGLQRAEADAVGPICPATEYVADKLLDEPAEKDKRRRDAYAERGFIHVPQQARTAGSSPPVESAAMRPWASPPFGSCSRVRTRRRRSLCAATSSALRSRRSPTTRRAIYGRAVCWSSIPSRKSRASSWRCTRPANASPRRSRTTAPCLRDSRCRLPSASARARPSSSTRNGPRKTCRARATPRQGQEGQEGRTQREAS